MITIPKPCPEKWENMSPVANGNYCGKCSKTVIDFSKSSEEEIITFLSRKNGEKVCGKVKTAQLASSKTVFSRFLAAIAIAFTPFIFSSCGNDNDHVVGDVAYTPDSTEIAKNKADSIEKAEAEIIKIQFSKEDSSKAADSVAKTKNPIRDFK